MSSLFKEWLASLTAAGPDSPAWANEPATLDPVLEQAVDTARAAIAEVVGSHVIGEHRGVYAESHFSATHQFECLDPAYRGWHWVAVLAKAPGDDSPVTVSETALLPGTSALVAPAWVPWRDRLEPGDLGARDTLPKKDDDPNLEPGFAQVPLDTDDDIDQIPNFELGLGRVRVLSPQGISSAVERWLNSDAGPEGEYARAAKGHCATCGYLMPMAGSVRTQVGVCANQWSPFDGRVVALDAGCGAHSETDVTQQSAPVPESVIDDRQERFDMVDFSSHADN